MNNFELIDDYLSNRLRGTEKEAFEKQLQIDSALRSDLDFQKQIIEGIRTSRAAELKTMLNKVPVGGTTVPMDFSVVRMAAGIAAAGVVGAAIYFYSTHGELPPFNKAATDLNNSTEELQKPESTEPDVTKVVPDSNETEDKTPVTNETQQEPARQDQKKEEQQQTRPAEKPKLDITDPSSELEGNDVKKDEPASNLRRSDITPSHVQVEMDSSNKKFDFHYQFAGNKLMLYGSFDRSLYEVLEINGDNHAIFFVYKDGYYLLDENETKITKLEPITDAALVSKLREFRKR